MTARAAAFDGFRPDRLLRDDPVARLDSLARWLDSAVRVPGTGIRIGADAVLGLVPGVGDLAAKAIALYLVCEARNLGLPRSALARMIGNLAIDASVGWIPVLGDAFDVVFRANARNMAIIREHLDRHGPRDGAGPIIEGVATPTERGAP